MNKRFDNRFSIVGVSDSCRNHGIFAPIQLQIIACAFEVFGVACCIKLGAVAQLDRASDS